MANSVFWGVEVELRSMGHKECQELFGHQHDTEQRVSGCSPDQIYGVPLGLPAYMFLHLACENATHGEMQTRCQWEMQHIWRWEVTMNYSWKLLHVPARKCIFFRVIFLRSVRIIMKFIWHFCKYSFWYSLTLVLQKSNLTPQKYVLSVCFLVPLGNLAESTPLLVASSSDSTRVQRSL